ncbi:hypothetical protein J437_LFUL007720 [Ladona fulva]|uniref:NADH dehydrogenase [ubiquinone] 1 alpha subcomplex assembly factor 3 n=1 Tax=Ladona fulva TaxID=123851 RepID=A0A8K0K5H8_LADFU|nr:hypothetical protein J437_LFUL007720 [Ladona fulva]
MLAVGFRLCGRSLMKTFGNKPWNFAKGGSYQAARQHSLDSEGKTSMTIMNAEPNAPLMVDSYSQYGFRLNNGLAVIGPMIIFPKTILSWNLSGPEDISEESLALFFALEPKLDILVLGMGVRGFKINPKVVTALRHHGTNVEVLTTDAACATFNFLNAEKRSVAGALFPPQFIAVTDDDLALSQIQRKDILKIEDI